MAATTAGCTVAANADSKALATAWAPAAAPDAWAAAALNHPEYGTAAAVIAAAAGPRQAPPTKFDVTDENDFAQRLVRGVYKFG